MYRRLNRLPRLLLVEDDPGDLALLKFGLEQGGGEYELRVAKNGEEALDFLLKSTDRGKGHCPDLILLDLNLPKISGHDVLRAVKRNAKLRAIPIVVLTSSSARSDITTAYNEGANSYLRKPDSLNELLDLMRTIQHYWLNFTLLPTNPPAINA